MDHEAAFLQAIIDRPADPQPRLIYADWLEEQGDVRAEFLRLQLQLAHQTPEVVSPELHRREKKLAFQLDPIWVESVRFYSTAPPCRDLSQLVPEIAPYARTTTRLHPHVLEGTLPLRASKIGGQFLWPADESWPICPKCEIPLAPIVQLRACDAPDTEFLPGTDLFQLFWCPDGAAHDYDIVPHVWWRSSSQITKWRADEPDFSGYETPRACSVFPEQVVVYPTEDDLFSVAGNELGAQIQGKLRRLNLDAEADLQERFGSDSGPSSETLAFYELTGCPGTIVGGEPPMTENGLKFDHLLTLSSWEFDWASYRRWMAVEDQRWLSPPGEPLRLHGTSIDGLIDPLGISIGRTQRAHVFVCRETVPWKIWAPIYQ